MHLTVPAHSVLMNNNLDKAVKRKPWGKRRPYSPYFELIGRKSPINKLSLFHLKLA